MALLRSGSHKKGELPAIRRALAGKFVDEFGLLYGYMDDDGHELIKRQFFLGRTN